MDDLNKRVLSVMEAVKMSKSTFAQELDISLPLLTHVSTGRNKPGIELLQKILTRFPQISADWLILGTGQMYKETVKQLDISSEIIQLKALLEKIPAMDKSAQQVLDYHALLLKEILYLNELKPYLLYVKQNAQQLQQDIKAIGQSLDSKLKV